MFRNQNLDPGLHLGTKSQCCPHGCPLSMVTRIPHTGTSAISPALTTNITLPMTVVGGGGRREGSPSHFTDEAHFTLRLGRGEMLPWSTARAAVFLFVQSTLFCTRFWQG